MEHRLTANP
uniref:Uncharacterized protein n=1 Tax=Arundo donax TaxID=35708 RepID=A0A0A9GTU1_ARUDO